MSLCNDCFHNRVCRWEVVHEEDCDDYTKDNADNRIKRALNIAFQYAQSSRTKTWIIDQMVRMLCGSEGAYRDFVKTYEASLPNGERYEWNTGNSLEEDES